MRGCCQAHKDKPISQGVHVEHHGTFRLWERVAYRGLGSCGHEDGLAPSYITEGNVLLEVLCPIVLFSKLICFPLSALSILVVKLVKDKVDTMAVEELELPQKTRTNIVRKNAAKC